MSLDFQKIRWKNFLSTGNAWTEIDFLRNKTTMIMGDNGAGKSTMLDALSFVLFGKAHRNIRKPQIVNSVNQKGTLVEIEFETAGKTYLIRRGIKPAIFEIIQNDRLIDQTAKAKDYQDFLERDILKMNHKSFTQIVILGSSTFVPFMQLPAAQRREVIEDLLDLQIFSRMNVILKSKISQNKEDIKELEHQIELAQEKIKLQKKHLREFEENNKAIAKRKQKEIDRNRKLIEECNKSIEDTQKKIEEYNATLRNLVALEKKQVEYADFKRKLHDRNKNLKKKEEFFENNDSCPTCAQPINSQFKAKMLSEVSEKLGKIDGGLEELAIREKKLADKISEFSAISDHLEQANVLLTGYNQEVYSLNRSNESLTKEINEVVQIKPETNIEELEDDIKTKRKLKANLNDLQSVYRVASEMLKDSGIKSRIIKQYVPIMNKLINHYLQQLGFFVQFDLDENFNETIKSRYLDVFSYDSFSEGEKLRIDLSLLFTWRQIAKMRNSVSTNLLIMDEVFDSSLDVNGTDEFIKILEGLTNDTNTFIISHKSEQLIDKFDATIKFVKKGNFSVKE